MLAQAHQKFTPGVRLGLVRMWRMPTVRACIDKSSRYQGWGGAQLNAKAKKFGCGCSREDGIVPGIARPSPRTLCALLLRAMTR